MKLPLKIAGFVILGALCGIPNGLAQQESEQHVELGQVKWQRDLQKAKKQSAKEGKPIFVLFQEVPG